MSRTTRTGTSPTRQAGADDRQDRRALVVMTLAHGIQHFYVAGLAVTYPFVVAQFHVSYAVLGLWLFAAGLLGGLLQAAAGLLRRASARVVLAAQDLAMGGTAERCSLVVLHYDADYERIAAITGQPIEWLVPHGTAGEPM